MTLGDQATRRVDHVRASKGIVARVNELTSLANGAQSKGLVGDELVGREAVVQLHNLHVLRGDSSIFVH